MANVMSVEKRNTILRLLVEGNSIRSTARLMESNIPGVLRQLVWAGGHCRTLMDQYFQNLKLTHIECDEIWTFVAKKQARLTLDERALCGRIGDVYLWTGIDQDTKLMPTFMLGKRTGDMARRFMMDLASRLAWPKVTESDARHFQAGGYRPIIQISTDGFAAYPEAVDLAFGPYAKFGVIIKQYRNATMTYTPSEMVGTERRGVIGINEQEESTICTSHIERNNLTIRTFMKRFTRLALGFSKKFENLEAAVNLHMAYYNFCWRPGTMRVTSAMAAGVTDRLWNFDDLMAGGK